MRQTLLFLHFHHVDVLNLKRENVCLPSFQKNTFFCRSVASALVVATRTCWKVVRRIFWISSSVNNLQGECSAVTVAAVCVERLGKRSVPVLSVLEPKTVAVSDPFKLVQDNG